MRPLRFTTRLLLYAGATVVVMLLWAWEIGESVMLWVRERWAES
jgi:hypothetical protein